MKFSYFSDSLISKFILFALGVVVGGYFCRNTTCALLFGTIFSLCLSEVYLLAIGKRDEKFFKPKDYNAVCEKVVYSGDEFVLSLLENVLSRNHSVKRYSTYLRADYTIFLAKMRPNALSSNDFIDCVNFARLRGYEKVVIVTHLRPVKCDELIKKTTDLCVKVVDYAQFYAYLRKNDALPVVTLPSRKQKFALAFQSMLDKKRAKSYFTCALTLFFLSSFVTSSIYYLLSACISLALGLAVSFLPREKKE